MTTYRKHWIYFAIMMFITTLILMVNALYLDNCTIQPTIMIDQEIDSDGLHVRTVATGLFFENEEEFIDADRGQPVALKWCPTFYGDRVRGVYTQGDLS